MKKLIAITLAALTLSSALLLPSCTKKTDDPASKSGASSYTIAGRDLAEYSVFVPADADECTKKSAETLTEYVGKASGVSLDVVTERGDGAVIEYAKDADGSLGDEGYNIKVTSDGDLLITCGAKRGSLYATYYILEKFIGYRFLTDGVEYLFETGGADIPADFNETEIPAFSYRALNQVGTTGSNFAALHLNAVDANGSGSSDPVTGGNAASYEYGGGVGNLYLHGHSYAYQEAVGMKLDEAGVTDLDSDAAMEIFRTYGYNTPERDALDLDITQPCLTSEDTFNHIMAFNYLLYKERCIDGIFEPGVHFTMIACSPNDNTDFCTCKNCKAVYEEEGSIAGAVFRLSNRVAEAMQEKMPGVGVFTIAYWDARNPPKYTKPDDNVCVAFCIGGCNNHTYDHVEECEEAGGNPRLKQTYWDGHRENSSNVSDIGFLERWAELTNNLYVWYYATTFNYLISPAPNVFNIYNDYKYIASLGVKGVYTEGSSDGYTFECLRG
ncbi:MAG: DUF4838 domain-containing protein, partial [Clostridia bacterium]|nr:DUF4838 domain-containing protein [Clostridia bacterium]